MGARIIILVITALWFWFCQHAYVCWIKQSCTDAETTAVETDQVGFPVAFNFGNAEPIVNQQSLSKFSTSLNASRKTEKDFLAIEGHTFGGEPDSLGMLRAEAIKAKLSAAFPNLEFRLSSMKKSTMPDTSAPFLASSIFWQTPTAAEIAAADQSENADQAEGGTAQSDGAETDAQEEAQIVSLPDRILIYHKFGSAERTVDKTVDDYLDQLAQRIEQTNEIVSLTGHTDNIGEDAANQKLGKERANFIKAILTEKGVPADNIKTASKGESDPIDTNDNEEGRKKNRRTELLLITQ